MLWGSVPIFIYSQTSLEDKEAIVVAKNEDKSIKLKLYENERENMANLLLQI